MGIWGQGGSQFAGYDYVQATEPESPSEGGTWYDLDADRAAVYDGSKWVEMTVTDHGQLGGINPWQHLDQTDVQNAVHDRYTDNEAQQAVHDRYSDSEAINATDGVIDAETVDGQHAGELEPPESTNGVNAPTVWENTGKSNTSGQYTEDGESVSVGISFSAYESRWCDAVRVDVNQLQAVQSYGSLEVTFHNGGSATSPAGTGQQSISFDGPKIPSGISVNYTATGGGDDITVSNVSFRTSPNPDHSHTLL